MKFNKLFLFAILATFAFIACDEEKDIHVYDGPAVTSFIVEDYSIIALDDENVSTTVRVETTTLSDQDRQIPINVSEDSEAEKGVDFEIPEFVTIPANEYFGEFVITSLLTEDTNGGTTASLEIGGEEGFDGVSNTIEVDLLHKTCDINDDFEGTYNIEQTSGDNGFAPIFVEDEVQVFNNQNGTYSFFATYLNDFGQGQFEFMFSLDCEETVFAADQPTGVGCGGPTLFLSTGDSNGSYNPFDDDEFSIVVFEDGTCGLTAGESIIQFTKED